MRSTTLRRSLALVASAALLASLTAATVAAPASAAKQKVVCRGVVATIVGTNKADRLVGTNKRDVIAGLGGNDVIIGAGGNDLICGGTGKDRLAGKGGRDRLYGNGGPDTLVGGRGPDRLFGGVGNDLLIGQTSNDLLGGGPGTDTCYQGTGTGPEISCELPVPPPTGPTLLPLTGILTIAYSDIDGLDGYSSGDVMISKIVDTNGDGSVSKGDTIEMGRYPTNTNPGPADFAAWGVTSHVVDEVFQADLTEVRVSTTILGTHWWWSDSPDPDQYDEYAEWLVGESDFEDKVGASAQDSMDVQASSPSQPVTEILGVVTPGPSDDRFIDVELNFVP